MENRYDIQKHMETVVRIALNECKEAFGEKTFNENKNWLTHRVWMDLGAMDAGMMADLLNCYTDLVNALREQRLAEIQLRKAERKASEMFQQTTAALSELK
uniref:Chemotaxis protein n=1 Tax=Ascaris lumbricoides TaxID=6252 RepID=A0A0M3IXR4_ASCLU